MYLSIKLIIKLIEALNIYHLIKKQNLHSIFSTSTSFSFFAVLQTMKTFLQINFIIILVYIILTINEIICLNKARNYS